MSAGGRADGLCGAWSWSGCCWVSRRVAFYAHIPLSLRPRGKEGNAPQAAGVGRSSRAPRTSCGRPARAVPIHNGDKWRGAQRVDRSIPSTAAVPGNQCRAATRSSRSPTGKEWSASDAASAGAFGILSAEEASVHRASMQGVQRGAGYSGRLPELGFRSHPVQKKWKVRLVPSVPVGELWAKLGMGTT